MKVLSIILLIALSLINSADYSGAKDLILDDKDSTIDGLKLTSSAQNGVLLTNNNGALGIQIKSGGTYVLTGRLNGCINVNVGNSETITLVLDGVKITCTSNNAINFAGGFEFYSSSSIDYNTAKSLDSSKIGARIILADDSTNEITGGSSNDNDGAISSQVSLAISGETKGNGILNLVASSEGMEIKKHLIVEGGVINISAQDDGINGKEDSLSVVLIKGGQLIVNGGLGREGDGIDSNGYLIVNGGTVIAASKPQADSGLDSNSGFMVNGGTAIGVGTSMDGAESEGSQPAMNLKFTSTIDASSTLRVVDPDGTEVMSFCPNKAGFVGATRYYSGATLSSPKLKMNVEYKLYVDNTLLGNSGSSEAKGGFGPGGFPGGPGGRPGGPGGQWGGGGSSSTVTSKTFTITYSATTFTGVQKTS